MARRAVARGDNPPSPVGLRRGSLSRFASEGWWGTQPEEGGPSFLSSSWGRFHSAGNPGFHLAVKVVPEGERWQRRIRPLFTDEERRTLVVKASQTRGRLSEPAFKQPAGEMPMQPSDYTPLWPALRLRGN
jgi:hypothetical protein